MKTTRKFKLLNTFAERFSIWLLSYWSRAKRRLLEEVLTQLCTCDPRGEKLQKKNLMITTSIFCE
jgi:hypothetical protein